MKVEIVSDIPANALSTKNEKAYKVVKDLYESENTCIKVTDEENEFKSITQMRNLLNEQARKYSHDVLAAKGIREMQLIRYLIGHRSNAFHVRKEAGKGIVYIKVTRYTDEEIIELRTKIHEAKKREEEQRTVYLSERNRRLIKHE